MNPIPSAIETLNRTLREYPDLIGIEKMRVLSLADSIAELERIASNLTPANLDKHRERIAYLQKHIAEYRKRLENPGPVIEDLKVIGKAYEDLIIRFFDWLEGK